MKKLQHLVFKATDWTQPSKIVKGALCYRDFKTLDKPPEARNENGYVVCIENEDELTIVDPDSIELVLKPHSDYDFENGDKVFVNNAGGSASYFILEWLESTCDWCLIPYTDKTFKTPLEDDGKVNAEPLIAFGIEALERVDDYEIDELP